MKYWILN